MHEEIARFLHKAKPSAIIVQLYPNCTKKHKIIKVASHPARYAVRLRIEIDWEICHVDLSLRVWQILRPKFKVWDCPHTSLAASSQCAICGDVWILAADENY